MVTSKASIRAAFRDTVILRGKSYLFIHTHDPEYFSQSFILASFWTTNLLETVLGIGDRAAGVMTGAQRQVKVPLDQG